MTVNDSPIFLMIDEVILIHQDQIERYGGDTGIRSSELLESAIAQPCATYASKLLHPTLSEQAAAYAYHLIKNHPFTDGNKRVGTVAALIFLGLNGYEIRASNHELEKIIMGVASGIISKEQLNDFFLNHIHKMTD